MKTCAIARFVGRGVIPIAYSAPRACAGGARGKRAGAGAGAGAAPGGGCDHLCGAGVGVERGALQRLEKQRLLAQLSLAAPVEGEQPKRLAPQRHIALVLRTKPPMGAVLLREAARPGGRARRAGADLAPRGLLEEAGEEGDDAALEQRGLVPVRAAELPHRVRHLVQRVVVPAVRLAVQRGLQCSHHLIHRHAR